MTMKGLCKLKKLQALDINHNHFEGIRPSCLSNLTSLKFFDISLNQFIGNISPSLFGSLNSLECIGLSHNRFEGLFSFGSFANHSNLEVVELISDNDKFELKILVLSNYNLNKLSGDVPKFLFYQNKLMVIDLSHNNLTNLPLPLAFLALPVAFIPPPLPLPLPWELENNSFVNLFFLSQYCYISTYQIDISDNHLSGQIQANIGDMFPYISYLNLSWNAFEGGIPSSFGKISQLMYLDLSSNNFSREVPNRLVRNYRSLSTLKLSNNNFRGQIFSVDFNLTQIQILQLVRNYRTSDNVLSKLLELYFLDISNNYMFGKIPSSIDNMTSFNR
ncbi:hypothetical protein HYC85_027723 [Camellia sinensis]|uniref:Leucine-rich repeat-containing N-terminal plant-type domain-containing protein n=1 Tax=Camellia sinensis TaxID=4442 RepID=A0A7J7FTA0_CAMSI|nr:hypothetical protein HYC85_027723 [Camellia sinensis]